MILSRLGKILGISLLALTSACGRSAPPPQDAPPPEPAAADTREASEPIEVEIAAKSGSHLTGSAAFRELDDGVLVSIKLSDAPPGPKGVHIHEHGDCSAPDASSAGDHFNPEGHPHALPPDAPRHLGDLGNIDISADGAGELEIVAEGANLKPGDPHSFLDRAVVIHGKADEGSQPSGNAGPRIGCGVIRR